MDKKNLKKLYSFFINLETNSFHIKAVPAYEIEIFGEYANATPEWLDANGKEDMDFLLRNIDRDLSGVELPDWLNLLLPLTNILVRWHRKETQPLEGSLLGGCSFNDVLSLLSGENFIFWEESHKDFLPGELPEEEIQMVRKLRWLESPSSVHEDLYTPMFGCVLYEEDKLPDRFFFYDSGYVFPMEIDSYGEYIEALSATAAVYCWQYFYIDPELIIAKYKSVRPDTIFISNASFFNPSMQRYVSDNIDAVPDRYPAFENGRARFWDEDNTIDRVDVIAEYLERCIRLLPETFPFLDFTHHKEYYGKFISLYKAAKS